MPGVIYLDCNHTDADPLKSAWTARWFGITETGDSIGHVVDRITWTLQAAGKDLSGLVFVVRLSGPIDLGTTNDRRPKRRRSP